MKDSALSIANYFVQKSLEGCKDLKPLKLMKLVYIAHGYMLALLKHSVLDPRFDHVEAWKLGPVIPSVYHSFKQFKNSPIKDKAVVFKLEGGNVSFEYPILQDIEARSVCDYVWKRYNAYTDSELVTLLHKKGTPWDVIYEEGMNNIIPDPYTAIYYEKVVKSLEKLAQEHA